jgi:hypothetical protein
VGERVAGGLVGGTAHALTLTVVGVDPSEAVHRRGTLNMVQLYSNSWLTTIS